MVLETVLIDVESSVKEVKAKLYDISYEFGGDEEFGSAYEAQEILRLNTRTLYTMYHDATGLINGAIGLQANKQLLTTLDEVLILFGNHPFHHVIEGRIARIVQTELGIEGNLDNLFESTEKTYEFGTDFKIGNVPLEFKEYAEFVFMPYNNPHLNYGNVQDLINQGLLDAIPPDYQCRFV